MSKTGSDELYTLIKALNKAEKAHFGKMALANSKDKKALHIKLYELLCKQKEYNEEKLLIELNPISKVNFSGLKKYLYAQIIKSLHDYHDKIDILTEIERHLHTVRIFLSKNLVEQANDVLTKAKTLALAHQEYNYLLVISSLEYSICMRNLMTEPYIKSEFENQKTYIKHIQNLIYYREISLPVYSSMIRNGGISSSTIEIENIYSTTQHPLLQSPQKAINFKSLTEYYRTLYFCDHLLNKIDEKTAQRQKDFIDHIESDKAKLMDRNSTYFSALSLMIALQLRFKSIDIFELDRYYNKAISFVKSLPAHTKSKIDLSMLSFVVSNYMAGLLRIGEAQKTIDTWKNFIALKVTDGSRENEIMNNHHLVVSHILLNKYKEALRYLNNIVDLKIKFRMDVQFTIRFYELIIHYELGNFELLPYKAKSTERFLIKYNGSISEFSKIILSYFKNILPYINSEERAIFAKMKNELLQVPNDPAHSENEVLDWIESKILNVPLIEIKKYNALNK